MRGSGTSGARQPSLLAPAYSDYEPSSIDCQPVVRKPRASCQQPYLDESKRQTRHDRQNRTRWRRIGFSLAAVLLAVSPFVLLEGVLRIFDVGTSADAATAGFGGSCLFELDEDGETYHTARHRLLFFGPQEFPREKPERTFRIFGLGGSTVHGRPYANGSSFIKWMELELGGRDSSREYETVNCGGLSYASYRLTTLLDEVLHYEPDLIVIATGHNEFLEDRSFGVEKSRPAWMRWVASQGDHLRTVNLARRVFVGESDGEEVAHERSGLNPEVEARLDTKSGYASYHRDERWRKNVIDQYEDALREMAEACRNAKVPLILVNLGENLRDCPPFKSEHGAELAAESLQRWQQLFDRASELESAKPDEAIQLYRQAESIDDDYALLAFRMGRCHDRLGNVDQARSYYQRARQLDICPLRMIEELHSRLKLVAGEANVPLVDAEALAASISPDGIPGNNCFMDHVHPDIGSHQQIGRLLADEVEAMGLVATKDPWNEMQRRRAYRIHFRRLGPAYLANGRRRVGWLEHWARRERLDVEAAPMDARGHLHLGKKRLDYGEIAEAWEQFLLAVDAEPTRVEDIIGYAYDLFVQGRPELACQILVKLHREASATTFLPAIELAYVITALDSGDVEHAEIVTARHGGALEEAIAGPNVGGWLTLSPNLHDRVIQLIGDRANLAMRDDGVDPFSVAKTAGTPTPAINTDKRPRVADLIDRAIIRNPRSAPLYLSRARIHFSKHDYDRARTDVTRCIELDPANVEAFKFRAILAMIENDAEAAVNDLTAAILLDANDPELLRMRSAAYRRLNDHEKADADLQAADSLTPIN